MDFPPNSDASKSGQREEKKIERVTTTDARRRRKPLRKQFSETFVAGDARSAVQYTIFEIMLPAARDMIFESVSEGFRNLMFGSNSRRRGAVPPQAGPTGYVSYNRMGINQQSALPRMLSQKARARHNFDEIVLTSRSEAEEVIDRLYDLVSKYDSATVSDLYELVGFASAHTDNKWGWTDLRGAGVSRVREGYLLDLPEPQPMG